jgi:Cu(I)/Ag(I) efflux system membrane protein CusA/SilA
MSYIVGLGYIKKHKGCEDIAIKNYNSVPKVSDIGSVQMGGDLRLGVLMLMAKEKW